MHGSGWINRSSSTLLSSRLIVPESFHPVPAPPQRSVGSTNSPHMAWPVNVWQSLGSLHKYERVKEILVVTKRNMPHQRRLGCRHDCSNSITIQSDQPGGSTFPSLPPPSLSWHTRQSVSCSKPTCHLNQNNYVLWGTTGVLETASPYL